ncbi:MAG TPA: hypothetical protein VK960_00700 [Acidimicrobiia bacterium]|nr:hypothetical protein [Acidimicrobiia bacterium]
MTREAIAPGRPGVADRFSLRVALLGVLFAIGVHVDGWAHNHDRVDESFFTPWHAILYGTYFAVAFTVVRRVLDARGGGASWREAVPPGYGATLAGIGVFFAGGAGDMVWHMAFGVEESLEALLSPTHLVLATGGVLMATGPFVGGTRVREQGWEGAAPAVITSIALLSFIGFMTQYMHPLSNLWPVAGWHEGVPGSGEVAAALGVSGFIWYAAVLTSVVLMLNRLGSLPTGAAGLLISGSAAFAVTQGDHYWLVIPAAGAAVVVETVRARLPVTRPGYRVLAFAIPAIPVAAHLTALSLAFETDWSVHLLAGTPVMAGLVGVLVSLVMVPPGSPES